MTQSVVVGFLKIVTVKLLPLLLNVTSRKFRELSVSPCLLNIKVRCMVRNLCMTLTMYLYCHRLLESHLHNGNTPVSCVGSGCLQRWCVPHIAVIFLRRWRTWLHPWLGCWSVRIVNSAMRHLFYPTYGTLMPARDSTIGITKGNGLDYRLRFL